MSCLNFEYFGEAKQHQKIVPGNTATGISAYCLTYREFFLKADGVDAGSTEPTVGQWIVGAAGAAGRIVSYSLDSGAWGNANARVTLRINSWNATAWVAAENIAIGANANHLTVRNPLDIKPCPPGYPYYGMTAKTALIIVYANTALCAWDGSIPDQTSLIGIPLGTLMSVPLKDTNSINAFKCIDYTASSASIVQVLLYF